LSLTPYYTLEEVDRLQKKSFVFFDFPPPLQIDDLFTEADANNRGLVSFDELLEFMIS